MSINLDDLTLGQIRELRALLAPHPGVAGVASITPVEDPYRMFLDQPVFIRSVTHHYTGRLVGVYPDALVIEEAAWIADDGRFHEALATGALAEIEPYPDGPRILGRGALLGVGGWPHPLPRAVK